MVISISMKYLLLRYRQVSCSFSELFWSPAKCFHVRNGPKVLSLDLRPTKCRDLWHQVKGALWNLHFHPFDALKPLDNKVLHTRSGLYLRMMRASSVMTQEDRALTKVQATV